MTPAVTESTVADDRKAQLVAGGLIVAAMAVVGALLGIVWQAWSPPGPVGAYVGGGIQAVDESEKFIGGDGRFLVVTGIVGLVAGVAAWLVGRLRSARGPYVALALAIGGVGGAALTEWVGYLVRGDGKEFACTAASGKCIDHLPLTVHMHGLLLTEAILAVLVYSLFVAFAVDDDLGRPEPRAAATPVMPGAQSPATAAPALGVTDQSVGTQGDTQHAWRHGDAAGAP